MNTIFVDLVAAGKVVIYLGNILIYSMTLQEHRTTTQEVLQWLADHDLYLWPEKCEFNQPCIEYLGLIIRQGEVSMDLIKVQAITTWPAPRTLRKLRGFLGFANFYCQFIKNFAKIARPLNNLTRKDTSWHWDTTQHQAFQTLKCAFSRHPILAMWDPNRPTRLEVDAFSYATGGVLLQWLDNDLWHPFAYRSQSRADAECNYEIYDKEMLTIIRALKDWQHYLEGLPQSFTIITDHQNLQFWHTTQNLTHCQAQWSLYLSHFNFLLTHKPSSSNTQADPLFRISTHTISDADNNKHQLVLLPQHFAQAAASWAGNTDDIKQQIHQASNHDLEVTLALKLLKDHAPQQLANNLLNWEEWEGLVFYKGRVYIPKDSDLRQKVVHLCHDTPSTGHPGRRETLDILSHLYWWPGMTAFVNKYVAGCDTC